jgi:hypothetical protein
VSLGVATATFSYPHGFQVGDTIHVSGFTGGASSINTTSATVATVGNVDYPTVLTFSTSAPSGTYTQQAGIISGVYTVVPHAVWSPVSAVSTNTSLTTTTTLGTVAGGASWLAAPDNYSNLTTIFGAGLDYTENVGGMYFVNNNPGNTGQANGSIAVSNWSHMFRMSTGAQFVLTHPEHYGFQFNGGTNAVLDQWTINSLFQTPSVDSGFPLTLGVFNATHPRVSNISSYMSVGNFLDIENSTQPELTGFDVENVADGGCWVVAASTYPVIANGQCKNSTDLNSTFMQNNYTDRNMHGAVLTNISIVNPFRGLYLIGPDIIVDNVYIEGSQAPSITVNNSDGTSANIKLAHIQINNNNSQGPASQPNSTTAAVELSTSVPGITVDDVTIKNSWGTGVTVNAPKVAIRNLNITNQLGVGIYAVGGSTSLTLSNANLSDIGGTALISNTIGELQVNDLYVKNSNKTTSYPGATGETVLCANNTYEVLKNVHIFDDQNPATGVAIHPGGGATYSRWDNVTHVLPHGTFAVGGLGTSGVSFIKGSGYVQALAASSTIAPQYDTVTISGAATINNITIPASAQSGDRLCAIDGGGGWVTNTGGNIGKASSPATGQIVCWVLSGSTWYPTI